MKNTIFAFLLITLCFYSNNTAQNAIKNGRPFSIKDTLITHLISQVSSDSIRSYTLKLESFGTRYAYAPDRDKVTNWIIDKFKSFGYSNIEVDSFLTNNIWCKNITAELKGKLFPDNFCITGAHYDSYAYALSNSNAPGADDNASGTAAVLEMARIAKLNSFTPNFTIKFITFDAEEVGLLGSANIANKSKEAGQKIKLMINQDMIATTASIDTIVNIICNDNFELYGRYAAAQTAGFSKLRAKVTSLFGGSSDYLSFSQNGYPSISYNEPELSDKMHSTNDLSIYCNYDYCAKVVRASFATLLHSSLSPSVVSDLVAANIGDGKSERLKWRSQKDSGIQHFKVYMGKSPWNFDSSLISLDTSVVFDKLDDGTAYYFGVSAIDNDSMEGIIKQISIIAAHLPFAPKNLADSPEKDKIVLKWIKNNEEDLAGYNIYRSMDS
ncbi:MAG: M20/M25/M40 family metallo-hydrolase, partial [Clostridiales bacterium]